MRTGEVFKKATSSGREFYLMQLVFGEPIQIVQMNLLWIPQNNWKNK